MHNKVMALMGKSSRSKYVAIGTLVGAIIVILFLVWPLFFHSATSTAVAPSLSSPIEVTGTSAGIVATSSTFASASVQLFVIAGTSTVINDAVSDLASGENTFTLLKNAAAKDHVRFAYKTYPGMGDLVTQIGGFVNGVGENYWQYTVNGQYMQVGADEYAPKAGDDIVWKFIKSSE